MNSRLGESVSNLHRAKIRLGKFKAVYIYIAIYIISVVLYLPFDWRVKRAKIKHRQNFPCIEYY